MFFGIANRALEDVAKLVLRVGAAFPATFNSFPEEHGGVGVATPFTLSFSFPFSSNSSVRFSREVSPLLLRFTVLPIYCFSGWCCGKVRNVTEVD
jgi:hypothetical protein